MKERFEVLDVFRGIFASMVVLFHLSPFSATPLINNSFIYNADLFVDFFFLLSGFVITYNYQWISDRDSLKQFYKKRFFRLYPLHLIIFLLFVIIELLKGIASQYVHVNKLVNESNNIYTAITNVVLLNSVKFPGIHDVSWNIASWSVSAEIISYLFFGIVVIFINQNRLNNKKAIIYSAIIFAAAVALYILTGSFQLIYNFDYGFLRGIIGFFMGALCYTIFNTVKYSGRLTGNILFHLLEPVTLILIITLIYYGDTLKPYGYAYETAFSITIMTFAFEKGWLSKLLKKSGILLLTGKYSYSIYMIHTLILSLFNIIFIRILKFPPSAYSYLFMFNYLLIWAISAWTFKHIEMRFNKIDINKH